MESSLPLIISLDVVRSIYEQLSGTERAIARFVCASWNRLMDDPVLAGPLFSKANGCVEDEPYRLMYRCMIRKRVVEVAQRQYKQYAFTGGSTDKFRRWLKETMSCMASDMDSLQHVFAPVLRALCDEGHELNEVLMFLGPPKTVFARAMFQPPSRWPSSRYATGDDEVDMAIAPRPILCDSLRLDMIPQLSDRALNILAPIISGRSSLWLEVLKRGLPARRKIFELMARNQMDRGMSARIRFLVEAVLAFGDVDLWRSLRDIIESATLEYTVCSRFIPLRPSTACMDTSLSLAIHTLAERVEMYCNTKHQRCLCRRGCTRVNCGNPEINGWPVFEWASEIFMFEMDRLYELLSVPNTHELPTCMIPPDRGAPSALCVCLSVWIHTGQHALATRAKELLSIANQEVFVISPVVLPMLPTKDEFLVHARAIKNVVADRRAMAQCIMWFRPEFFDSAWPDTERTKETEQLLSTMLYLVLANAIILGTEFDRRNFCAATRIYEQEYVAMRMVAWFYRRGLSFPSIRLYGMPTFVDTTLATPGKVASLHDLRWVYGAIVGYGADPIDSMTKEQRDRMQTPCDFAPHTVRRLTSFAPLVSDDPQFATWLRDGFVDNGRRLQPLPSEQLRSTTRTYFVVRT